MRRAALLLVVLLPAVLRAQLAITEVLPVSRMNTNTGFQGTEFWELTNFGTNDMNLHGYGFRDSDPTHVVRRQPFTNLIIRAGESVIFFRIEENDQDVTTPELFRAWWGESKVPTNLQCRIYRNPGLSGWDGDAVAVFDPTDRVVDYAEFGRIHIGSTFSYSPQTGLFGEPSTNGVHGAFAADLTVDVGSPGRTAGPVPAQVLQHPADENVDGGMTARFSVRSGGMPRPSYQWFRNGALLPGATEGSLVLPNVKLSDAGGYHVVIANGLSTATSRTATLTVNTSPTAPGIVEPPEDVTVFDGQTAVFQAAVRGYPPPAVWWQTNGVDVPNSTGPILELTGVSQAISGLACAVIVSNAVGTVSAGAVLTVTRRPQLRITEVMAAPANIEENRHFGWVELTNYDTNAVDLFGWRFSESDSFLRAVTVTNHVMLRPGQSLVIAERLDAQRFVNWWGPGLPSMFNIYTYSGFGLNPGGGTFFLWNAAARDPHAEIVSTVSWAAATPGVSSECETECQPGGCVSDASTDSILGFRGAFRAQDRGDIGSPGYVENPPLEILSIAESDGLLTLACRVTAGKNYRLWRTASLDDPHWTSVRDETAGNNVLTFQVEGGPGFYRVQELP